MDYLPVPARMRHLNKNGHIPHAYQYGTRRPRRTHYLDYQQHATASLSNRNHLKVAKKSKNSKQRDKARMTAFVLRKTAENALPFFHVDEWCINEMQFNSAEKAVGLRREEVVQLKKSLSEQCEEVNTLRTENNRLQESERQSSAMVARLQEELNAKDELITSLQQQNSEQCHTSYSKLEEDLEMLLFLLSTETGVRFNGSLSKQLTDHFHRICSTLRNNREEIQTIKRQLLEVQETSATGFHQNPQTNLSDLCSQIENLTNSNNCRSRTYRRNSKRNSYYK